MSLVFHFNFTHMSFVCRSHVLVYCLLVFVCHLHVTRMYSYVTRMSLSCTRMLPVSHSSVVFIMSRFSRLCLNATSIPTGYALLFLLK